MPTPYDQYIRLFDGRRLYLWGFIFACLLWLLLTLLHLVLEQRPMTLFHLVAELLVLQAGAWLLLIWLARRTRHHEGRIAHQIAQLDALHAAALAVTSELELNTVLQNVIDLSRELLKADYGALSVLDENGRVQEFVTSGITQALRAKIGAYPVHMGLLGVALHTNSALRVADLAEDGRSVGVPPHHPAMHSLLAVPVTSKGCTIGTLFLADKTTFDRNGKPDTTHFSEEDEEILLKFATQSAIAIENARLYRKSEKLAVLQERDRFGRELHDGVIQSIYAVGLMLEDCQQRIESEPQLVYARLGQIMANLNSVIMDIRSYILDLRPRTEQPQGIGARLAELIDAMFEESAIKLRLETDPLDPGLLSSAQAMETLRIAQEALLNAQRHALSTEIVVRLHFVDGMVDLQIEDNGVGFMPDTIVLSGGLHNMQERAQLLEGQLKIQSVGGQGTCVHLCFAP